ncbi:MAG: hypothetical protein V1827_00070 [Candidatus Micrarchaeota archaeon]
MVSITLSVPIELKKEMERFPEINWSEIARQAIQKKIILLRRFREFTRESEFNEEDALRLGKEASKAIAARHKG